MNFIFHIWMWAALAVVVLGMAAYRYLLVRQEDSTLDIMENNTVAAHQSRAFRRANAVEHWGKILTLVLILYGLTLAGAYVMHLWRLGQQIQH
jgi:hypothetical protein